MALREQQHGFEVRTIVSADGSTRASFVPELGGIGSSIVMPSPGGPRELLYRHDFFWNRGEERTRGGWPFLFPICGRLELDGGLETYRWNGRTLRLPLHGFAGLRPWRPVDSGRADELTMELADDEATRAGYPFRFRVTLTYRAEPAGLVCEQTYRNGGDEPMPFYAGFHPYLLTPPPGRGKEGVRVDLRSVRSVRYNERFTDIAGEEEPASFPCSVADPRIADLLSRLGADKEARLLFPDGGAIHIRVDGLDDPDLFGLVQFYTVPEEPFFCIEPWMGHANGLNSGRNVCVLPPGRETRARLRLWVT
jgi:galactose mutarotase-like enzyme